MKRLIKAFIFLFFALNDGVAHSQTTASVASNLVENHEIVSVRPIDIMTQPQTLMKLWIDEPIPLAFYTEQEKEIQKQLNDREDGIIAYSPEDKIVTRDIDQEEITPFTWKWVYFEIEEENGEYAKVSLRRPNWWLKETGATKIGNTVYLSMYEAGVGGDAKVTKISPNQLDTRFWDLNRNGEYISRPITGKVEHYVNNVVYLVFEEYPENPLSVTTNHLLWSNDRNDWTRVEELNLGEKITAKQGVVTVRERIDREGWYIVYDIEVYRDHNFLVGMQHVLAHNGCGEGLTGKNWKFDKDKDMDLRGTGASYREGLEEAFKRTGVDKKDFVVTKWGKDKNGKSIPVEWEAPGGAAVNMDIPEWNNVKPDGSLGEGPHQPHIGYQTPGKRNKGKGVGKGSGQRGHIFVDDVPTTR